MFGWHLFIYQIIVYLSNAASTLFAGLKRVSGWIKIHLRHTLMGKVRRCYHPSVALYGLIIRRAKSVHQMKKERMDIPPWHIPQSNEKTHPPETQVRPSLNWSLFYSSSTTATSSTTTLITWYMAYGDVVLTARAEFPKCSSASQPAKILANEEEGIDLGILDRRIAQGNSLI